MNASPPTIAPTGPPTRRAQKIASCVEAGPGRRLHAAIASSNSFSPSQCRRSTTSRRSRAMCVGGPPKPVTPIRSHSRAIVAGQSRAGRWHSLFSRGPRPERAVELVTRESRNLAHSSRCARANALVELDRRRSSSRARPIPAASSLVRSRARAMCESRAHSDSAAAVFGPEIQILEVEAGLGTARWRTFGRRARSPPGS